MSVSVIHNFNRSGATSAAIGALARMMAARDGATHQHAQRVQHYAVALAEEIGIRDDRTLQAIEVGALLHDIGKLGVPDSLLAKPGPLTPAEYERVKQHSAIGADLLSTISFPGPLSLVVRHHHENWDGSGYPDGLRGENIPIGARVLAVVDCYDALTSDRRIPVRKRSCPAHVDSNRRFIYTDIHASGGEPDRVDRVKILVPMKRGGTVEEVASAILWLLSDEASYTTGTVVQRDDVIAGFQRGCCC